MTLLAIMRPKERLQESISAAREAGFDVICASPIEIQVLPSSEFDEFLRELETGFVDVVVFTSATGVQAALDLAENSGTRTRLIEGLRTANIAAIGPATMRRLEREGVSVSFVPEQHSSEGLAEQAKKWGLGGGKAFVLRSDKGSASLLPGLTKAGLAPREIIVYSLSRNVGSIEMNEIIEAGRAGRIDAFLFSSSLSARSLIDAWAEISGLDQTVFMLNSRLIAAIGPPTRATLESYGIRVDIVPVRARFEEMIILVQQSLHKENDGNSHASNA